MKTVRSGSRLHRSGQQRVNGYVENSTSCPISKFTMMLPAISARQLFRPAIDLLKPLSPARYHNAAAHEGDERLAGLRRVEHRQLHLDRASLGVDEEVR